MPRSSLTLSGNRQEVTMSDFGKGESVFNSGGLPFGLSPLGKMGYDQQQELQRQAEQQRQNQQTTDGK
jgi:hypothetical protein